MFRDVHGITFWETKIEKACGNGNITRLQEWIDLKGVKYMLESKDHRGETLLHIGASWGKLRVITFLINLNANVHARCHKNRTPLHKIGYTRDRSNGARLLIEAGSDIEACDDENITPLILATRYQAQNVVDVLIEKGANVNHVCSTETPTALFLAVKKMNADLVRTLLKAGADIHLGTSEDKSLLAYACLVSSDEIVRIIIDAGGNVNDVDVDGDTILHLLIYEGRRKSKIFNTLIEHGADVDLPNAEGYTPLQVVMVKNWSDFEYFVPKLIAAGANIHIYDDEGHSLLHEASRRDEYYCVRLCLAMGLKYEECKDERTLMTRCIPEDPELLTMILALGADPTIRDTWWGTPLDYALKWSHNECAKILESMPFSLQTLCWVRIRLNEHFEKIMSSKNNKRQRIS